MIGTIARTTSAGMLVVGLLGTAAAGTAMAASHGHIQAAGGQSYGSGTIYASKHGRGGGGVHGAPMPAGPGGHGHGPRGLLVTSVSGDTIIATAPGGTTSTTIHVSTGTSYYEDGTSSSLGQVIAGAYVRPIGTTNSDGSINASSIVISLPAVSGVVTNVGSGTLTLAFSGPGGGPRGPRPAPRGGYGATGTVTPTTTINVASDATYQLVGRIDYGSASANNVAIGTRLVAEGTYSNGVLTARRILIQPLRLGGTVISIGGSSFTLSQPDGTRVVNVRSTTVYTATPGMTTTAGSVSFNALRVGLPVYVEGTGNSDGSVTALLVSVGELGGPGSGPGGGKHHGHGPRGGPGGPRTGYSAPAPDGRGAGGAHEQQAPSPSATATPYASRGS